MGAWAATLDEETCREIEVKWPAMGEKARRLGCAMWKGVAKWGNGRA